VSEGSIKDRLDQLLVHEFSSDVDDVHTRWYSRLSDAPLFGAGARTPIEIHTTLLTDEHRISLAGSNDEQIMVMVRDKKTDRKRCCFHVEADSLVRAIRPDLNES
jgi:hypothetical protein